MKITILDNHQHRATQYCMHSIVDHYVEKNSFELYFSKVLENTVNYIKGTPTNIADPEILHDL